MFSVNSNWQGSIAKLIFFWWIAITSIVFSQLCCLLLVLQLVLQPLKQKAQSVVWITVDTNTCTCTYTGSRTLGCNSSHFTLLLPCMYIHVYAVVVLGWQNVHMCIVIHVYGLSLLWVWWVPCKAVATVSSLLIIGGNQLKSTIVSGGKRFRDNTVSRVVLIAWVHATVYGRITHKNIN